MPRNASARMLAPVAAATIASTIPVATGRQTRNPKTTVRLIQTKWNGIVSQLGHATIAPKFAAANAAQASSTALRRDQAITRMSHRLDGSVRSELPAKPPDADVDHVRARVEVVAPDVGD